MPDPITKRKLLVVEGPDCEYFLVAFLKKEGLDESVQVQSFGGVDDLGAFLTAIRNTGGFTALKSLGIVRDAETSAKAAFKSVRTALSDAKLPVPDAPLEPKGSAPCVSALILPDAQSAGMLEDLCLRTVEGDLALGCIDEYFRCLEGVGKVPKIMPKARIQAFLASRERFVAHLGQGAAKGYFPWKSPALDHVREFLHSL